MLLVAITGPVGSEKTSVLRGFAETLKAEGLWVDGFVSLAGKRTDPTIGADSYTWLWMRDSRTELFAERNSDHRFEIQNSALQSLRMWGKSIPSKPDLIVLDEFGKWEAEGEGILSCWKDVIDAKPRMVVVSVREGVLPQIEERLGHKFHQVLEASSPKTPDRLLTMFAELKDWELVGVFGASSGGIECSLGTWLHAIKFPLVGTVMGSVQSATLALASNQLGRKELVVWIATIAAGLKALSPNGVKVTVMIAITVQGFLFALGAIVGRWTKAGLAFGAFLVGLWAALQGFFIQYLLMGKSLDRAWGIGANYVREILGFSPPSIWIALLIVCLFNGVLSASLTFFLSSRMPAILAKVSRQRQGPNMTRKVLFWMPLLLVVLIFAVGDKQTNNIVWLILRVVAVCLATYGVTKLLTRLDFAKLLGRTGHWGPSVAFKIATEEAVSSQRELPDEAPDLPRRGE